MIPLLGWVAIVNLFFTGLLAGEEFVIRFGVRTSVSSLDDEAHIRVRQSLILRLRILVPLVFALALLSGVAVLALAGSGAGFVFRCGGLLTLIAFIAITMTGTVPINQAVLGWCPASPPADWRRLVRTWERLDTFRTLAALAAFVLSLIGMAVQPS
jgi:uncharacterized membrane protein